MTHQYDVSNNSQSSQQDTDKWILQRSAVRPKTAKTVAPQTETAAAAPMRDYAKGSNLDLTQIPVSNHSANPNQLQSVDQSTRDIPIQRQEEEKKAENKTGLPDSLKAGIESMSGFDLSGVRVNYNSSKPAQLNAHAYTQGNAIEVAPGQEKHVPHEAWHVVQQMQGRVKPTMQMKEVQINDDDRLEKEADRMGERSENEGKELIANDLTPAVQQNSGAVQRSHSDIPKQLSGLIVQRYDLIPGENDEDKANGKEPVEKLDGPDDKKKRKHEEEDKPGSKRAKTEKTIQTKRESGQLVFGQKQDTIQRSEKDQPNLWVRTSSQDHQVPFWGRTTTNSQGNDSLTIQRAQTRSKGAPPSGVYKGMAAGGGGGRPRVPKSQWQTKTVGGTTYNFWNEADGTIEFTGKKAPLSKGDGKMTPGPALPVTHSVNIDAGGGKLIHTGRSLKNTRYQHFLAANIDYEGTNPPTQKGSSPPNKTWHHHKNKGIMELIDRSVHAAFGHHGGFSIWGS